MKKLVCLVLALTVTVSGSLAQEIRFREIEWGTRLIDVVQAFDKEQQEGMLVLSGVQVPETDQFMCFICRDDLGTSNPIGVEIVGANGLQVAGYDNVGYTMYFAYCDDEEGNVNETSAYARLYAASYNFYADNLKLLYEDLFDKLSQLYDSELIVAGERFDALFGPENKHDECGANTVVWGSADKECYLILSQYDYEQHNAEAADLLGVKGFVTISYVWKRGDELLDRSVATIDKTKANDTSGL